MSDRRKKVADDVRKADKATNLELSRKECWRTAQLLEALNEQRQKTNALVREFETAAERRFQDPNISDAERQTLRADCELAARHLGAVELFLSPLRSGSPLALSRAERSISLV